MGTNDFLMVILPNIHIILGVLLTGFLLIVFPKNIRKMDREWIVNNIKPILLTSFGVGGFTSICIGLSFVAINGDWPSDYIPTSGVSTSIVITIIYIATLIYHDIKSFKKDIERRYGTVEPKMVRND